MVVETEDREELTAETIEAPSSNGALVGWLSAIHSEMREMSARAGRTEERVTRIEAGIEAERNRKNRLITWLGIGVAVLFGIGGTIIGVIGLLN